MGSKIFFSNFDGTVSIIILMLRYVHKNCGLYEHLKILTTSCDIH